MSRTRDLPERGVVYVVTRVGSKCPLTVGENVTFADAYTVDFLAGGIVTSFKVRRESGEVVEVALGPVYGATLRPETRTGAADRRR